ncbi:alpha/beta fold hydrolase [Pseudonocardia spinosispora]|uniref:alpha/beta fold hydrolase n=1 Tax=Pseudonocardia spinosispora TaxID=103441 RepID=UPI0003F63A10|nr:alpha/beta hydrolase [Pseudonocardia spinosispora]
MTSTQTEEATVLTNGFSTHFHEYGPKDGTPLLMLHGSGPGVSAWANWRLNMAPLAERGYRVLAPDLVGFGYTERPADVYYSLDTWREHVWSFMDVMELGRTSIVGNSLGGRIALHMAGQHPERIERMVLMGAPGVGMTITEGLKALRAYQPSEENMRQMLLDCFAVDKSIITDDLVRTRYKASMEPGAFEAYTDMFSERHAGSQLGITEEQVRAIGTRTLLLHGREDKVVPVDVAWNMVRLLPDADLAVFAHCGHWTQIERATDFNAVVHQFLSGGGS